jgi:hypothetical protein
MRKENKCAECVDQKEDTKWQQEPFGKLLVWVSWVLMTPKLNHIGPHFLILGAKGSRRVAVKASPCLVD